MLGRVDQDRYDASSARSVPTQEELDYPQYFASFSSNDATQPGAERHPEKNVEQPDAVRPSGSENWDGGDISAIGDRWTVLKARAVPMRYEIKPSIGYSLPKILLPYLYDARTITIRDPYLRKQYQVRNVHEILLELYQVTNLAEPPRVVIETQTDDDQQLAERQMVFLDQLRESWAPFGVDICWTVIEPFHDRLVTTDTGWIIDIGRGLDIYDSFNPTSSFDPRYALPELRRAKDVTININRVPTGRP